MNETPEQGGQELPRLDELIAKRNELIKLEGSPLFMEALPERWLEDPHYRCPNDHVSTMFLRTEERGDRCLGCHESVIVTFPEDRDGPIDASLLPVRV